MSRPGETDTFMVEVRAALLDALEALGPHLPDVVVIGAQAVYLHTGAADVAISEYTKDADLAIDPRALADDPRVEAAMEAARFVRSPDGQPGSWLSPGGIPVDLMVPEALAGPGPRGARGARIPPHDRRATRRAAGLEAVVVDAAPRTITPLGEADDRSVTVRVAGPAALIVAKVHKIAERTATPHRLVDKDAHDVYRLLRAVPTDVLRDAFQRLLAHPLSAPVTTTAIAEIGRLFTGPDSLGAVMAGRAEEGVGHPAEVAASVAFLATDLVESLAATPETQGAS